MVASSSGTVGQTMQRQDSQPVMEQPVEQGQTAAAQPRAAQHLQDGLRGLLAVFCHWLLLTFSGLQDAMLAIASLRRVVAFALVPRCRAAVLTRLLPPAKNTATFDNIGYHVDAEARKLLLHGSLHSLVHSTEVASSLPAVGRILLQTGARNTGRFQQAAAAALARQLGAALLIIDDSLLRGVSMASLGAEVLDGSDGGGSGLLNLVLSLFLSGGKMAFVWDVIAEVCSSISSPLVVLVKDAEATLCSTWERCVAFEAAMGSGAAEGGGASGWDDGVGAAGLVRRPIVLLGGCGLGDSGAHAAAPQTSAQIVSEDEKAANASSAFPPGADDSLGSMLLGNLSIPEDRPNARKMLAQLFPTRVRLQAPTNAAEAARHAKQLAHDAASAGTDHNYRSLLALATARNIQIPAAGAELYSEQRVSAADWAKVLAWAISLEAARARTAEAAAADEAAPQQTAADAAHAGNAAGSSEQQPASPTASAAGGAVRGALRRCMSASNATSELLLHSLSGNSQPASPRHAEGSPAGGTAQPRTMLSGLTARIAAFVQPSSGSASSLGSSQQGKPLRRQHGSSPSLGEHAHSLAADPAARSEQLAVAQPADCAAASPGKGGPAVCSPTDGVAVSEEALRYGLHMLRRTGGGLRGQVHLDNAYERRMLAEVIQSDDAGTGFREVGALSAAKDALREAVQLPLQHPQLFSHGSLARPVRGVLLFGPPGTGKTLLARAAAAECGAAFLAITPSALSSKWLGDGVRNVRAVFSLAAKLSPCVIFIDEVDALLGKRNSHSEHEVMREMKNEVMAQWDGIRSGAPSAAGPRIMVLGATNRPGDLDEAVLRRFSRRLFCDLPDRAARAAILQVVLEGENLAPGVDLDAVAANTEGFSGSDLRQLCVAAAMRPVRELLAATGKSARRKAAASSTQAAVQSAAPHPADSAANGTAGTPGSSCGATAATHAAGTSEAAADEGPVSQGTVHPASAAAAGAAKARAAPATAEAAVDSLGGGIVAELAPQQPEAAAAAAPDALLSQLLAECDAVTREAAVALPAALRPLCQADFDAARKDVTPSVAAESAVMAELRAWNSTYGEGSKHGAFDPKLTYFM